MNAGLWFVAQTAAEAYLRQELRKLCGLIEHKQEGVEEALPAGASSPRSTSSPSPTPVQEGGREEALELAIERIIQDACELPDRTSPDDQPEMLLITGDELDMLLRRHLGLEDAALKSSLRSTGSGR